MFELDNFYRLSEKDISKAAQVCERSYSQITMYKKALEGIENKSEVMQTFFEIAIRFGIKYGFAYAFSERLEGIAIWVPDEKAEMTMGRMVRSSGLKLIFRLMKMGGKFMTSMKDFSQLDKDRKQNMAGKQYLYLMNLAVDPDHQRKGIAGRMVEEMNKKAFSHGYSIYVSADIDNVEFYKKHQFRAIKELNIKIYNEGIPNWEMVRNPI